MLIFPDPNLRLCARLKYSWPQVGCSNSQELHRQKPKGSSCAVPCAARLGKHTSRSFMSLVALMHSPHADLSGPYSSALSPSTFTSEDQYEVRLHKEVAFLSGDWCISNLNLRANCWGHQHLRSWHRCLRAGLQERPGHVGRELNKKNKHCLDAAGSCSLVLPSESFSCGHLLRKPVARCVPHSNCYIFLTGLGSGFLSICVPWTVCGLDLAVCSGGQLGTRPHPINDLDFSLTAGDVLTLLHICPKYTRKFNSFYKFNTQIKNE